MSVYFSFYLFLQFDRIVKFIFISKRMWTLMRLRDSNFQFIFIFCFSISLDGGCRVEKSNAKALYTTQKQFTAYYLIEITWNAYYKPIRANENIQFSENVSATAGDIWLEFSFDFQRIFHFFSVMLMINAIQISNVKCVIHIASHTE